MFVELDQLRRLRGTKWSRFDDDVLAAWIADMDAMPASAIRDAVVDLFDRGDLGYLPDDVDLRVGEVFAARQSVRNGWRPDPTGVRLLCDVNQGVAIAIERFSKPGDGVAVLSPCYPPILEEIERAGRRVVPVPLRADQGWQLDRDDLADSLDPGTTMFVLVNPHNPTGHALSRQELTLLAELALERELFVVSDEIHQDLVWGDRHHIPVASVDPLIAERTLTLTSAAKGFNIAGAKCAVAHLGGSAMAALFDGFPVSWRGQPSAVGVAMTLAAWSAGDDWLADIRRELEDRRDQVTTFVADHLDGIGYRPPEATYLAWFDLRPLKRFGLDLGDDPATFFESNARVALGHGPDFGPPGVGHVRVNFATSAPLLGEILERMVTAIDLVRAR